MAYYTTPDIRNIVLLGHGGSGKTSIAEAMLYASHAIDRMGKIDVYKRQMLSSLRYGCADSSEPTHMSAVPFP